MRVLAAILAVLLFFPGACFAFFGIGLASDGGWPLLLIAVAIFILVYVLGRYGFGSEQEIQ